MLPAAHRLRRPDQFRAVLRGRQGDLRLPRGRAGGDLMTVHLAGRPTSEEVAPRVGFVVSKSVGNSVERHRTQRRLRHQTAAILGRFPSDTDVVIRAHPRSVEAPSSELRAELERLVDRALQSLSTSRSR